MPRSVDELDLWAREHELRHAREHEERRREGDVLIDAVKRHVDGAVKPIADLADRFGRLEGVNREQLAILKDSAEERGRRMQREADAATKKSSEEISIGRWKILAGIITAIAVALIAFVARHNK